MGHSDIKTTRRYVHLTNGSIERASEALNGTPIQKDQSSELLKIAKLLADKGITEEKLLQLLS